MPILHSVAQNSTPLEHKNILSSYKNGKHMHAKIHENL